MRIEQVRGWVCSGGRLALLFVLCLPWTRDVTVTIPAGASGANPTANVSWVAVSILPPGSTSQRVLRLVVQPNPSTTSQRTAQVQYAGGTLRVDQSLTFNDSLVAIAYNTETANNEVHSVSTVDGTSTFLLAFRFPSGAWTGGFTSEFEGALFLRDAGPNNAWLRYDRRSNTIANFRINRPYEGSNGAFQDFYSFPPPGKETIAKRTDGSIHIGTNSLITVEDNGTQKLFKISTDPNEKTNLLTGILNFEDGTNYAYLCNEMTKLVGVSRFCGSQRRLPIWQVHAFEVHQVFSGFDLR